MSCVDTQEYEIFRFFVSLSGQKLNLRVIDHLNI